METVLAACRASVGCSHFALIHTFPPALLRSLRPSGPYRLQLVGHSLGGAVAALAAVMLREGLGGPARYGQRLCNGACKESVGWTDALWGKPRQYQWMRRATSSCAAYRLSYCSALAAARALRSKFHRAGCAAPQVLRHRARAGVLPGLRAARLHVPLPGRRLPPLCHQCGAGQRRGAQVGQDGWGLRS